MGVYRRCFMFNKISSRVLIYSAPIVLLALVITYYIQNWHDMPSKIKYIKTQKPRLELFIDAPTQFTPGSLASARIALLKAKDLSRQEPVASSNVTITLKNQQGQEYPLFKGVTDPRGTVNVSFKIPDLPDGAYQLLFKAESPIGSRSLTQEVKIKKDYKILLITDKPIYQPNQVMHLRALVLGDINMKPAVDKKLLFEIEDSKGNKVFKKETTVSDYGVAFTDFQLADEINLGEYRINALLEKEKSEKTVKVYKYVLPKFKIELTTDKKFYLPNETIKCKLDASYFFGKPIVNGEVTVKASTFDYQFKEFDKRELKTDANGKVDFEVKLPDYFVGQPLDKGNALVKIDVSVKDTAEHTESITKTYPVAKDPIIITVIPEGGKIVPDVENIIYVLTSAPDGTPIQTIVTFKADKIEQKSKTNSVGFTSFKLKLPKDSFIQKCGQKHTCESYNIKDCDIDPIPEGCHLYESHKHLNKVLKVDITAKDAGGNETKESQNLFTRLGKDNILLRLNKAIYKGKDTIVMDIFGTFDKGAVFIDIVKKGQTMLTTSCELKKGYAQYYLDPSSDIYGSIEIHAYKVMIDGNIVRDSKVAYVHPPQDLNISITKDKKVYLPGEDALIRFQVRDTDGKGVQSALGLVIVDESVYALQDMQPGLEKVYFTLEKELSEPKYQIKYAPVQMPELIQDKGAQLAELEDTKQDIAKMILAKIEVLPPQHYQVNTVLERRNTLQQKAGSIYTALREYIYKTQDKFYGYDSYAQGYSFRNGLVADALKHQYGKDVNLKERIYYSWGEEISMDDLIEHDANFAFEKWADLANMSKKQKLFNAIIKYATHHDAFDYDIKGKTYSYKKGLLKDMASLKCSCAVYQNDIYDILGKPFDLKDLAKKHHEFNPKNMAEIVLYNKKLFIMTRLLELEKFQIDKIAHKSHEKKAWVYKPNALDILIDEDILTTEEITRPDGQKWTIASLVREDPAFELQNLPKVSGKEGMIPLARQNFMWKSRVVAEPRIFLPGAEDGVIEWIEWGEPRIFFPGAEESDHNESKGDSYEYLSYLPGSGGGYKGRAAGWNDAIGDTPRPHGIFSRMGGGGGFGGRSNLVARGGSVYSEPRIRDYFPETLLWQPHLVTNEKGCAELPLKMADSITTWRLTTSASSRSGFLGSTTDSILVFQDFFVDIDFPVALTQNDEVSVPIAVYNYLKEKQTVKIAIQKEDWFELLDYFDEKKLEIEPNEVKVVYFGIKVKKIGSQTLTVKAYGSKMSDAVKRPVEVMPDGKMFEIVINDKLSNAVTHTIEIPENAIDGSYKIVYKCYPGIFSQIMEGIDGMLKMPYGCFEQTSSITYPNVLALDYLKKVGRLTPAIEMKAVEYINIGYQRLLSFEVQGGGFDWYGKAPANIALTAYGLLEFSDMAKVYEIDDRIILRTRDWLLSKQSSDGSWESGTDHGWSEFRKLSGKMIVTSYVAWSLLESGYKGIGVERALNYIKANLTDIKDPYVLALIANALVIYDPKDKTTEDILAKLDSIKIIDQDKKFAYWSTSEQGVTYSTGRTADIETTALAAYAMMKTTGFSQTINNALTYLVKTKSANGTWGSTSATILTLKSLLKGLGGQEQKDKVDIAVKLNGVEKKITVTPDQCDVLQLLDLKEHTNKGRNTIDITVKGESNMMYQIVGRYYLPWREVTPLIMEKPLTIKVDYDRTSLKKDDTLKANIIVKYSGGEPASMVIIDLGVPPGFIVEDTTFSKLLKENKIEKYNITGRQIIIYLRALKPQEEFNFSYDLKAKYPIKAKTPKSTVYEYYTPEHRDEAKPVEIEVKE